MKNRLQSKNVLFDQGREAPHILIGLSGVFEKKVGDFVTIQPYKIIPQKSDENFLNCLLKLSTRNRLPCCVF
jgi:hypothetical protein